MARKASAKKSAKSSKRKVTKKVQKKVAASKKRVTRRAASKKAPARSRTAPKRGSKKAPARTVHAAPVAAKPRMAVVGEPAKTAPPQPSKVGAKGIKGARPAGQQGALEFEAGPPGTRTLQPHEMPVVPKRRGSKQSGPDWPGENLTVGMAAPEFELPSTLGRKITLQEFRGKRVILYFYPKDDTPGCTMEACAFRDNLPRIEAKDGVVLGISLDDELSHQRFAQKYNLPFPLLSDVDAAVSRQYGVYKEKNMYGRSFWGIERTTFVVDREGKVENVFRRVKVEGHADEVLATLAV